MYRFALYSFAARGDPVGTAPDLPITLMRRDAFPMEFAFILLSPPRRLRNIHLAGLIPYIYRSKFRDEHPLAQRKAMASKIQGAGKGVNPSPEKLNASPGKLV